MTGCQIPAVALKNLDSSIRGPSRTQGSECGLRRGEYRGWSGRRVRKNINDAGCFRERLRKGVIWICSRNAVQSITSVTSGNWVAFIKSAQQGLTPVIQSVIKAAGSHWRWWSAAFQRTWGELARCRGVKT